MIDTRLLTFLTLLEEKSFTKTALKLNFTQPAVTHHIKALEKEYEVSLFLNTKNFELTKAGKILLEYAKESKMQYDLLINNLKKQESNTPLKLGITYTAANELLSSNFFKVFNETLHNYNTYTFNHEDIQDKILNGELDLGIIDNSFDSSRFESIYISSSKIILVCSPNGRYIKDRITREMLLSATIILSDKNTGLYKATISALHNKNIRLRNNLVLESNNISLMVNLIEANDGIAFVYEDSVKDYISSGRLKKLELLNFGPTQNFYLLYNRVAFFEDKTIRLLDRIKRYGDS